MPKPTLPQLDVRTRANWRAWLATHHASSHGVWLVIHKKHTGVPSVAYDDAVREALCFGWIDSLVKRLDDDRYVQKLHAAQTRQLLVGQQPEALGGAEGGRLLAAAGLAAAPTDKRYAPRTGIPEMPASFRRRHEGEPEGTGVLSHLPRTERRHFVGWVHMAKRPETREKRLRESIETR